MGVVKILPLPLVPKVLVAAVVPSHGRHSDIAFLLSDLGAVDIRGIDLRVVLVDNASNPPLESVVRPPALDVRVIRLEENTGGSGGFNAGLQFALEGPGTAAWGHRTDYIWLLDSDVRVSRRTLRQLVRVLSARSDLCAAGASISDPRTGVAYEIGGRVSRWLGTYGPMRRPPRGRRVLSADYLSACCLLVRADAVARTGLLPDVFLSCDDVEWTSRLRKATSLGLGAVPGARAYHPAARFVTWARYCQARNAFGPIDSLGLGPFVRFTRTLVEGVRAAGMIAIGRDDLAGLHIAGLRAAAEGHRTGPPPHDVFTLTGPRPRTGLADELRRAVVKVGTPPRVYLDRLAELDETERAALGAPTVGHPGTVPGHDQSVWPSTATRILALAGAVWRLVAGPSADLAIASARDDPAIWFRARTIFVVTPSEFWVSRTGRWELAKRAVPVFLAAARLGVRIAFDGARPSLLRQLKTDGRT